MKMSWLTASFLLKFKVQNGGEDCLAIDNWAISGTIE